MDKDELVEDLDDIEDEALSGEVPQLHQVLGPLNERVQGLTV
eukprot:CAMPEP_0170568312 /NCGR_PEP_ID=MMETSP0211-20121228/81099_1 /TAXON_ID=311385 /ORGANISM="Pseudokeronopsis sp., Strain OXSARD2" /LENGTH=41 /DNA_ID= /DNA_START= /DNA_END= /DNA_ORIENTATION=